MLTEEQIQKIEDKLTIKRETRPDGKCAFGLYEKNEGCGNQAVNWLPIIEGYVGWGRPALLNVCKHHADLFRLD